MRKDLRANLFLILLFFSLTFYSSLLPAQSARSVASATQLLPLQQVQPIQVDISLDRLKRIDDLLENAVQNNYLPGAVVMIGRKGQVPYLSAFGYRDVASKEIMKTDDIFRMASMTKPIISVGIMMLYEQGHFLLDDPISKFAPEFAAMQVLDQFNKDDGTYTTKPTETPITFRHLLTHTSGIGYPFINPDLGAIAREKGLVQGYSIQDISLKDNMKLLSEMPLLHQPGERWTYGLSTDLLGYLIEVISGQALDIYLEENLFGPLGMKDTHFYMKEEKADRLVKLYYHNEAAESLPNPDPTANFPYTGAQRYFSGGAGLVSTAMDYGAFLQMLLNQGSYNRRQILSRKTIELMTTDQLQGTPGGPEAFSLGFAVTTEKGAARQLSSVGNYRWSGIFGTDFWVDPQEQLFGIILTQVLPFQEKDAFFAKIQNGVYQALE